MLLARVPHLRKIYLSGRGRELVKSFFSEAGRWLRSPDLMETRRIGFDTGFAWNVFTRTHAGWTELGIEYSKKLLGRIDFLPYLRKWAAFITDRETEIHELAEAEIAAEAAPSGRIVTSRGTVPARLVGNTTTVLRPPVLIQRVPDDVPSVDDFAADDGHLERLQKKASELLALRNVRQKALDVRNAGGMDSAR